MWFFSLIITYVSSILFCLFFFVRNTEGGRKRLKRGLDIVNSSFFRDSWLYKLSAHTKAIDLLPQIVVCFEIWSSFIGLNKMKNYFIGFQHLFWTSSQSFGLRLKLYARQKRGIQIFFLLKEKLYFSQQVYEGGGGGVLADA